MTRRAVFVCPCLILGGLAFAGRMPRPGYVFVASIPSHDLAEVHVTNLLSSKGIRPIIADAIHIGVEVPKKDESKAVEILRADGAKHPYHYVSIDGYKGKLQMGSLTTKTLKFNLDLASALDAKPLKFDSNLRAMVKEAKKQFNGFKNVKLAQPYLAEVTYWQMSYLNSKGKWDIGYQGTIKWRSRSTKASIDSMVTSWDGGQKSSCIASVSSLAD